MCTVKQRTESMYCKTEAEERATLLARGWFALLTSSKRREQQTIEAEPMVRRQRDLFAKNPATNASLRASQCSAVSDVSSTKVRDVN